MSQIGSFSPILGMKITKIFELKQPPSNLMIPKLTHPFLQEKP